MLERALERAVTERTSHLFTLLGPAGVGKSRLVGEFLGGPAASATVLRGRCLSYGEGITFFPLAEVIHQAAGILEGEPPDAARAKLAASLADTADGERIASLVGGLFGWSPPGATEDSFWAVRKVLEHLARERPGRRRLRRHPLGRADDARPDRASRRLDARRRRPAGLCRSSRAARHPLRLGWRQDERHLDPSRAPPR